jgi:hypothetical protein
LRRLGLPEVQMSEPAVTKDSADPARSAGVNKDGLE